MRTALVPLLLAFLAAVASAADEELESALSKIRNVPHPDTMSEDEKEALARSFGAAWKVILDRKEAGATRLRAELATIGESGGKDDFFLLSCAALLWELEGLEAAEEIGKLLSEADLTTHYRYAFLPGYFAAKTGDARALPILRALLRDKEGTYYLMNHALTLRWPLTHDFLWGIYGPVGLPALTEVLETSDHPVELESAAHQLAKAQHLPARPALLKLADSEDAAIRRAAVRALGSLGHPEDFERLAAQLESKDPEDLWSAVYALYEYGDLRAAARIAPLAGTENERLRDEVCATVLHLLWPETFEVVKALANPASEGRWERSFAQAVEGVRKESGLDTEAFAKLDRAEQEKLFLRLHKKAESSRIALRDLDRELSHEQLLLAIADWMERGRIRGGTWAWVEDRHVLAAAGPEDLPLLLKLRAKVFRRLSDEALGEARTLERLIHRIGRSRVRKDPGVCRKVEPN